MNPSESNAEPTSAMDDSNLRWAAHHFDHTDPTLMADPFSMYGLMRKHCPITYSDAHGGFFVVSRYDDVRKILRDHERFSSSPSVSIPAMGNARPMIPLEIDRPEHSDFVRLLSRFFSRKTVAAFEPRMRSIAGQLLERVRVDRDCDVLEEFARKLPVMALWSTPFLGEPLPVRDGDDWIGSFQSWVHSLKHVPAESESAAQSIYSYLDSVMDERRMHPQDDIPTALLNAQIDGARLSEEQVRDTLFTVFIGGVETTAGALAHMLMYLASHPSDQQRLREQPTQLATAIEEWLRYYGPTQALRRTVRAEGVTVQGTHLPSGSAVLLLFNSAGHDDAQFGNAQTVCLDRTENPHLAFGAGIHRCIGSHLARLELRVGLEEILSRLPEFRLKAEDGFEFSAGVNRSPKRVVIEFPDSHREATR